MPGSTAVREQLRLLRKPGDSESLLQMLQRSPAQRTAGTRAQPNPSHDVVFRFFARAVRAGGGGAGESGGGGRGGGEGGGGERTRGGHGGDGGASEQVRDVQAARGADGVQVQVRDDVLWVPPVPGTARLQLRFQGDGERPDRQGQPRCQGR